MHSSKMHINSLFRNGQFGTAHALAEQTTEATTKLEQSSRRGKSKDFSEANVNL